MQEKLYPLQFEKIQDGFNTWLLADLGQVDSLVNKGFLAESTLSELMNLYMDKIVGERAYLRSGRQFPITVKVINLEEGELSELLACPNDEIAMERYDSLGKRKLWYILDASYDARLCLGLNQNIDGKILFEACNFGIIDDYLNEITPLKGEFYHVDYGTLHAYRGKIKILEISEASYLDFSIAQFGQNISEEFIMQDFGMAEAMDWLKMSQSKKKDYLIKLGPLENLSRKLIKTRQFSVNKIELSQSLQVKSNNCDSYVAYICTKGGGYISVEKSNDTWEKYKFVEGGLILLPADVEHYYIYPEIVGTELLEVLDQYMEPCACAPSCECGCQQGKECTCNDPFCRVNDDCDCIEEHCACASEHYHDSEHHCDCRDDSCHCHDEDSTRGK